MKTITLFASLAVLAGVSLAQDSADTSPEKAAVLANDRAYEAAYAKADVKAMADFFTGDAQYTSEDGRTLSGRAEIEGSIRAAFQAKKGAKLAITLDSVRVLSPEVVLEKGSTAVTAKDGETDRAPFTPPFMSRRTANGRSAS